MFTKDNAHPHLAALRVPTKADQDIPAQRDDDNETDDPTKPWFAARGRPEFGIDFMLPDGTRNGFEYSSLIRRDYEPGEIVLTFMAVEVVKVSISGRNLEALFDLIRSHRCCKVRQAERDFETGDSVAVVTMIAFEVVKED